MRISTFSRFSFLCAVPGIVFIGSLLAQDQNAQRTAAIKDELRKKHRQSDQRSGEVLHQSEPVGSSGIDDVGQQQQRRPGGYDRSERIFLHRKHALTFGQGVMRSTNAGSSWAYYQVARPQKSLRL